MKSLNVIHVILLSLAALIAAAGLTGCSSPADPGETNSAASYASGEISGGPASDEQDSCTIDLSSLHSDTLTLSESETVRLIGSLNGKIVIDTDDAVTIILAGVSVTGDNCLEIQQSDAVTLLTEADTVNTLQGSGTDAVLSAKGRLILGGDGILNITSYTDDAIYGKRTVTMESGTVNILAAGSGIAADGEICLLDGVLDITAGNDALKADDGRIYSGNITVSGGEISLTAVDHGIKAAQLTQMTGGSVSITSGADAVSSGTFLLYDGSLTADTTAVPVLTFGASSVSGEASAETDESEEILSADGIRADIIRIIGGTVSLACTDEGLQADTEITVAGGDTAVISAGDGFSSADSVTVSGGKTDITSDGDGIQAVGDITLSGGSIDVLSGGGGGNAMSKAGDSFGPGGPWGQNSTSTSSVSCKSLKTDASLYVAGGTISLNSDDDGIAAAVLCRIDGGDISIYASDDAIHCDDMLVINDGMINVTECFEGLEAFAIEVNGGDITLRTVNDGINANGSEGGMFGGGPGGFPGQQSQSSDFDSISGESTTYYKQTGGTVDLVVTGNNNNVGDGIDSNGAFTMTGGTLTVSTRGDTQEGAIDTGDGGGLLITGGQIIAGGASMMQEGISTSSTQCAAVISTDQQAAGTTVTILDSDGNEIWSKTLEDVFNCLVITHPDMTVGNIYTVTYGSSSTTLDFTDSNVINMSGGFGFGGFPGGGGFGGGGPGGGPF